MVNRFAPSLRISAVLTAVLLVWLQLSSAQVATSTNFQIQSDSINFGGGLSTSTNYRQESTFGEIGTGNSTSTNYQLRAGYQQMQEVYLSMTSPNDVIMSPDIPGLTGGTSNGSTTVTVTTDSPAGYQLTIEAANDPAMQSGANSIEDYSGLASFNFNVSPGTSRFGYSVFSADAASTFLHNGSLCYGNGPTNTAQRCWIGLSTSPSAIAESTDANHPDGTNTTLYFRVGIGAGAGIEAGVYTATTTLTALPL